MERAERRRERRYRLKVEERLSVLVRQKKFTPGIAVEEVGRGACGECGWEGRLFRITNERGDSATACANCLLLSIARSSRG